MDHSHHSKGSAHEAHDTLGDSDAQNHSVHSHYVPGHFDAGSNVNPSSQKKTYAIKGMHCASCVAMVERSLKKQEGVNSASVNYASEKVTIDYDPKKIDEQGMQKAVKNAGYELLVPDAHTSSL